ncbi:MAG: hypothetical protein AAF735_04035 [Myxococcota bacterium]
MFLVLLLCSAPPNIEGGAEPDANARSLGPLRIGIGLTRASARVQITSVETEIPDSALAEELVVDIGEEVDVETLSLESTVTFNWRFLELSALAGLATTESGYTVRLSGELPDDSLFPGPFDVALDSEGSQSGYLVGFGGALYLPLVSIDGPLVLRTGSSVSFRRFDTLSSTTFSGAASLIKRQKMFGVPVDFSLGSAYSWISRRSELKTNALGSVVTVRIEQELRDPWSLVAAVGLPLGAQARLLFATTQSFTGTSAYSVRLAF